MKIKIISDGRHDTKIIDEDSGELLGCVQKIVWKVNAKTNLPQAVIDVAMVPVELSVKDPLIQVRPVQATNGVIESAKALIAALPKCQTCERNVATHIEYGYEDDPDVLLCDDCVGVCGVDPEELPGGSQITTLQKELDLCAS